MVQTSDEQSRKVNVEIRKGLKYYHNDQPQENKGWYWCSEKKAFFRYSDWFKPMSYFV